MKLHPIAIAAVSLASFTTLDAADALSRADLVDHVKPQIENGALQAVSLGVIQNGIPLTAHAGTLAPDNETSPDDRTLYEIGSVSKVFTALLLADAVIREELQLDTVIADLLPDDVVLPDNAGKKITLRMLATHTSGLPRIPPEMRPDDYRDPYAAYGTQDLWTTLRSVKLDFEPGTKAAYSNLGAGLLGELLVHRAGSTYAELIVARIAQPLGMQDTVVELDDHQRSRLAAGYNSAGALWPHWEFQALAGAGAIRSSTADMMRFAAAMLHPERTPLARAIDLAWEKQTLAASVAPGGQALGWMLAGDGRTRWHNGMTGGFQAALFVNREYGFASLLLCNRSNPIGTVLAESLARRAAGLPEQRVPNQDRAEVAITEAQLDRCTGTFRLAPQFALVFERRNRALYLTPTGQPTDRLYAASPNTFFSRRVAADIVFELPEGDGPATSLVLKQNGREIRGVRE